LQKIMMIIRLMKPLRDAGIQRAMFDCRTVSALGYAH